MVPIILIERIPARELSGLRLVQCAGCHHFHGGENVICLTKGCPCSWPMRRLH